MLPLILCLLLLGGITAPASAKIYKYTDKNGVVRYTNDPTQVPEDKLPGAISFKRAHAARTIERTQLNDMMAFGTM